MAYSKYKEGKSIGQGAFGEVYDSIYTPTGEHRAIKKLVFSKEALLTPDKINSLAAPLLAVKNPNLVNVLDVFPEVDKTTHKKVPFVVVEYLNGYKDLRTIINKNARLNLAVPEETVALYLAKTLAAVHALHINGITHQNIKPENIHIPDDTDENEVRVSDVGLLQFVNGLGDDRELGTEGVKYWAPEAFSSPKYLPASDVYSVGAVFYELMTGKPAYPQTDKPALAHFITHKDLLPIEFAPDSYSKPLLNLVNSLLGKDPAIRPTAAAAYGTLSSAVPALSLPALPAGTFTAGVSVYGDIPPSMDVLRKKLVKAAKSIPDPKRGVGSGAPSASSSFSPYKSNYSPSSAPKGFGAGAAAGGAQKNVFKKFGGGPGGGGGGGGGGAGFGSSSYSKAMSSAGPVGGKTSVSYLRSIFEKGVANSFSFSPSAAAQGVKRLAHYDARGNLIGPFKGASIMDRLRKRKGRASDIDADNAQDLTDVELEASVELDQTSFDDFFAQQQTQVNSETRQQNTPTQAVGAVLASSLPSDVLSANIADLSNSAGNAAAQNVAALWRAENRVRDLTAKLGEQERNGAPAADIAHTKKELKEAEEEVRRLRTVVQADERAQATQAEARRQHRVELARAEAQLRQLREKLAAMQKPGSGATQQEIEKTQQEIEKQEAEVARLRAIVMADDAGQSAPHRAELARAEAFAKQAHERLAALEKPGSGASSQQITEQRAVVKTADENVVRLRAIVAQDEAAQNARNAARAEHRADLAHAELIAAQAHEHLSLLEHPDSGASQEEIASAARTAQLADQDVVRRRAIVQKDDEDYAREQSSAQAQQATTYTTLTVNQLSLMEQGVLKVSEMLEKGETDVGKVFDDGVAELILKTLLLANNGFAAAVEKVSRNKTAGGKITLDEVELITVEEAFIANAYVINACLFIINNFSLSPDTRHRKLLIEGYNAITILLTSLSLAPLSSPTLVAPEGEVLTPEAAAEIVNASFALSDLFNISVGCLNEDEEVEGDDEEKVEKENRIKKYFVPEENDNVRKLFGFILTPKVSGAAAASSATSSTPTEAEVTQENDNKLLALRILFTIYKSSALPSILTVPSSPVYSGPYADVLRMLLRFMNTHIANGWNQRAEEAADKRKETMTSVAQLLFAILYVIDINHNLHLFVEEGITKTMAVISGSSPSQVLHSDSDEEEVKTYGLLVSTAITIIDKIYVFPYKAPDFATTPALSFLRTPETATFVVATVVPVLLGMISSCLPPPTPTPADASTLALGALFSVEDQNALRDESIACLAAFLKSNILSGTTLPTTKLVSVYSTWIRAAVEVLSQWTVEKTGQEEDLNKYSSHIHIMATTLNNFVATYKIGPHVGENGGLDAFFSMINNKYINIGKNNATLLVSTYPKLGAILSTFIINFALIGSNSSGAGKENIFLQYYLKIDGVQYLGRFIETPSFKTAFTPAQQFGFVRASFFFFKDSVVDAALFKPFLQFLHGLFSAAQTPPDDIKNALKCLVVLASRKENQPTLKGADLASVLDKHTTSSVPDIAKVSLQLRSILK